MSEYKGELARFQPDSRNHAGRHLFKCSEGEPSELVVKKGSGWFLNFLLKGLRKVE